MSKNEPVCIADEVPFEIPESWEWVRLGTISTYAETKKKVNAQNADPDLWGLDLEDIEKGGRLISKKTVGERKAVGDKTIFKRNDILYSKLRPYLLKILVAPDDGICTSEIVPFSLYGTINAHYIVAFLKSPYVDQVINSVTYGVKMPRVGTETMTSLLVPLPPISEQARIVARLKCALPKVQNYSTAYEKGEKLTAEFPTQLKKSIFQYAVQGKLVPQDPTDEPTAVLLERIRAEKEYLIKSGKIKRDKHESVIFRRDNSYYERVDGIERCIDDEVPFEIPASWAWTRLTNICSSIADGDHQPPPQTSHGIPFLVISDVSSGKIDFSNTRFVPIEYYMQLSDTRKPRVGDLLFTVTGSYGIVIPVLEERKFCFQRHMALLKPLVPHTNYLELALKSPLAFNQCRTVATGTAQKTVGLSSLKNLLLPIPPIEEQDRILDKMNSIMRSFMEF